MNTSAADHTLPDAPMTVIEASRPWLPVDLAELWRHRELLYVLAKRDLKVRYKQTLLGFSWIVLQPVAMTVLFSLIFGRLAQIPSDGLPYPIFVFAALLPWTFFANAVANCSNSLVNNSALITKVYFPRVIVPLAAILSGLVDLAILIGILLVAMLYYGLGFSLTLIWLIPLALLTALLAAGVGIWLSAINVKYRDVRHAVPFALQLWFFATPIIYSADLVPTQWRPYLAINPMATFAEGFRSAAFNRPFDLPLFGLATALTITILTASTYAFRRSERHFADII